MKLSKKVKIGKRYALADKNGKVMEKFRLLSTAIQSISYYRRNLDLKLHVIDLESDNTKTKGLNTSVV